MCGDYVSDQDCLEVLDQYFTFCVFFFLFFFKCRKCVMLIEMTQIAPESRTWHHLMIWHKLAESARYQIPNYTQISDIHIGYRLILVID